MNSETIKKVLWERYGISVRVECHRSLDSTNTLAREKISSGAAHGTVITAETQTAGRGRRGRSFYSEGGGLYMSVILRGKLSLPEHLITPAAAVAVCRALEKECGAEVAVKWVNDIFSLPHRRKICGILCEKVCRPLDDGTAAEGIVVGIGVNLTDRDGNAAFPEEIREIAGAVKVRDKESLCAAVAGELLLAVSADPAGIMAEYASRQLLTGEEICFERNGTAYTGIVKGTNGDGNLLVQTASGEMVLSSGEISIGSRKIAER